jgi:hypothetical protein
MFRDLHNLHHKHRF